MPPGWPCDWDWRDATAGARRRGVCGTEVARPPQEIAVAAETSYAREARTGAAGLSFPRRRHLRRAWSPILRRARRPQVRAAAGAGLARGGEGHAGRAHYRVPDVIPDRGNPPARLRREPRPLRAPRGRRRIAAVLDAIASSPRTGRASITTRCPVAARRADARCHAHLVRGYVLSKHKPLGRRIVSDAYLFCLYKILGYGMGMRSR